MAGDQFVTALRAGPHDAWGDDAVLGDALGKLPQFVVLLHMEWVILERMELGQLNVMNFLPLIVVPLLLRGEKLLVAGQTYVRFFTHHNISLSFHSSVCALTSCSVRRFAATYFW